MSANPLHMAKEIYHILGVYSHSTDVFYRAFIVSGSAVSTMVTGEYHRVLTLKEFS